MLNQSLYTSYKRYQTLRSGKIRSLPIVILMPHSSCNCRCIMCDIWKGNHKKEQLTAVDIEQLLSSFRRLGTTQVVMSGGEALLNPLFFSFCSLLQERGLHITLLSTGLLLKKHAESIVRYVNDVIISLDGDPQTHDAIRNIDGAFDRLKEGVMAIKALNPSFRISARTVIQRLNFRCWSDIIDHAKELQLDSISFLPADLSSEAFNREEAWDKQHTTSVAIQPEELGELRSVIESLYEQHTSLLDTRFISESRKKLMDIYHYYAAVHGFGAFPVKRCNAPWVSAVIEADGKVRPCFFHKTIGNIREDSLQNIVNGMTASDFRAELKVQENETCKRCVCSLNLPFYINPASVQ